MKVGDLVQMIRRRDTRFQGIQLQPLVGIVSQDETEQQPGHHLTRELQRK